jgi:hypothetical protein
MLIITNIGIALAIISRIHANIWIYVPILAYMCQYCANIWDGYTNHTTNIGIALVITSKTHANNGINIERADIYQ